MNFERFFLLIILLVSHSWIKAQCPTSNFSIKSPICIGEQVDIEDLSMNGENYSWDFCDGSLTLDPSIVPTSQTLSGGFYSGSELIKDPLTGHWYLFVVNFSTATISRIYFGETFSGEPISVTPLVLPASPLINGPADIAIVNNGSGWFGVVTNFNSSSLTLLDFGENIFNDSPALMPITPTLASAFSNPQGITMVLDDGNYYALVSNFGSNNAVLLNFESTMSMTPSGEFIAVGSTGWYSTLVKDCDSWHGYISTGVDIKHLDFGSTLSSPSVTSLSLDVGLLETGKISVFNSLDTYFLIIASTVDGKIYRVSLGNDLSAMSGVVTDLDDIDGFTSPFGDLRAFEGVKVGSDNYFYGLDRSGGVLQRISFINNCGALGDEYLTQASNPSGITYTNSGTFNVSLRLTNSDGAIDYHFETVTVDPDIAPSISFSIDNSRCLSNTNSFTPSNTSLTSYDWDFNGDGMVDVSDATGADQSFDYSSLGTGTYTVRLSVSDGICDNFFEQEITIYDPPPVPSYTFSSLRTCKNTDFTFANTTIDAGYMGPLEYLWEFIDEPTGTVVATANTRDAVYAFETEGLKTVRLTSSIPGCTEVIEQNLTITPGPTANFFAASVCEDEAMQFTNTSADAISYFWDFGDGFSSTAESPSHIFNGAGNFFVTLTATDVEGCTDSEVIEVAVSNSPQISFDFDIPCTSADGIQFLDLTTVDNADLVSWRWFVDDVEVSTLQSPQIVFESTGVKTIRLDVQSSNGCESSYSEDVDVLASPTPDFNVNLGCLGEQSTFTDNTTSSGNPVVSWLWTVDGMNYATQDINHVFSSAGTFEVTLEVTGQNFCSESITKTVNVIQLPTVNFTINGECNNQIIRVFDQSTEFEDLIVARRWTLDGSSIGSGTQLFLSDLAEDTYELALELETQAGCIVNSSQSLVINDAPESSFTSSRTFGIPNDRLTFSNTSIGGVSYQWLLDGVLRSTNSISESITFSEAGTYNVDLVSQNSLGCYDTATQEILIAIPEVDLSIGSFELVNENNVGRIFLEIQNLSNLPVESVEARIVLENTFAITEQIVEFIDVGASSLVSLNAGIPLTVSEPSYFCVTLISPYEEEYSDLFPVNNEKCITIEPIVRVESPFPNPVSDQFRLKLVTSEAGTAKISLFNSTGKVELSSVREVSSGLNNYFIDMSTLYPGIYYVVVEVLGTTHREKIIKL